MTFSPADVVDGRYRIEGELGRGGMGVVYRATHLALDRPVALKRLSDASTMTAEALQRFRREAQMAVRIRHEGLVQVLDAGVADGTPYLVMELVSGVGLDVHLAARGPLPVDDALRVALDLADALAAAHRVGVVHRDVKPANVLVETSGRVRLVDFGLATPIGDDAPRITRFGAFVGTPEYLAPEVALGAAPGPAADVYALGVTLYELLTGELPFSADHPVGTVLAHLTGVLTPASHHVPSLPPRVDRLLQTLLERQSDLRPRDADAARVLLEETRVALANERPPTSTHAAAPRDASRPPATLDELLVDALVGPQRSSR